MQASAKVSAIAFCAVFLLAGCGGSDTPRLMNLRTKGPDEFAILPARELEMPTDLNALPAPTPGGSNRTDRAPLADAIVALGGRPDAGAAPAADAALFAHSTRFGTDANIRATLAAEDLDHRRRNDGRLLERIFNSNVYLRAYEKQSLDQNAERAKWRARGLPTPSAPPVRN